MKTYKIKLQYHFNFKTFTVDAENEKEAVQKLTASLIQVVKTQNWESDKACLCCMTVPQFMDHCKNSMNLFGNWQLIDCKKVGGGEYMWLNVDGMEVLEYIKGKRTGGYKVVFTNPDNKDELLTVRVRKNSNYTDFTTIKMEEERPEYLKFEFTFRKGNYDYMLDHFNSGKYHLVCKPVTETRQYWQRFEYGLDGNPMRFELLETEK